MHKPMHCFQKLQAGGVRMVNTTLCGCKMESVSHIMHSKPQLEHCVDRGGISLQGSGACGIAACHYLLWWGGSPPYPLSHP